MNAPELTLSGVVYAQTELIRTLLLLLVNNGVVDRKALELMIQDILDGLKERKLNRELLPQADFYIRQVLGELQSRLDEIDRMRRERDRPQ